MKCAIITSGDELGLLGNDQRIAELKNDLYNYIRVLLLAGYDSFYVNCEYGVPLWAAEMICEMKKERNIKLHLVIPYEEQALCWREDERERYYNVHEHCDSVYMIDYRYNDKCYAKAKDMMLKKCDRALLCRRRDDERFPFCLDDYDISRVFLYF